MQGASRDSLQAAHDALDDQLSEMPEPELTQLGQELFSVARLLAAQRPLTRHLADPTVPAEARAGLLRATLGSRVGTATLATMGGLVSTRWSRSGDLIDATEDLARRTLLAVTELAHALDTVEDELFRFGRILSGNPQLRSLLADPYADPARRAQLLDAVLADKVLPTTRQLLEQTILSLRGRNLEDLLEELTELVALRRERSIAQVVAAAPLSERQEQRLGEILRTIYGRAVSLQVEINPDLLGGLVVRVGDDVIDGSVAGQLEQARQGLPD